MIWAVFGFSAGLVGGFCAFLDLVAGGKSWYEDNRMFFAVCLGLTGMVLFVFGRLRAFRRSKAAAADGQTQPHSTEDRWSGFSFLSVEYWGVMLIVLGVTATLYNSVQKPPEQKAPVVAQVQKPKPPEVPVQKPEPPPPPRNEPVFTTEPPPNFKIQGLFYEGQGKASILVNGVSYASGDSVNGVDILEVKRDSVTVRYGDETNQRLYTWFAK